jgi:hypothetical protein
VVKRWLKKKMSYKDLPFFCGKKMIKISQKALSRARVKAFKPIVIIKKISRIGDAF